jgi:hypothetical protein
MHAPAGDVDDFRRRLIRAFPPRPFFGLISTHDECDDGIHLRRELAGKSWDELSPEVIFHGSIGLPLLEPDALVAFLPAWLLRVAQSLRHSDVKDVAAEFTFYFLCPGSEDEGWDAVRIAEIAALFDSYQRLMVADVLQRIAGDPGSRYWHAGAEFGLQWWR